MLQSHVTIKKEEKLMGLIRIISDVDEEGRLHIPEKL